ncbi:hypothetical protein BDZ97DRAFT_1927211 [Flammula alnicola]|nr:hypothetical protein BDZ97DRAFT_1927211 [Flammula alnicola]
MACADLDQLTTTSRTTPPHHPLRNNLPVVRKLDVACVLYARQGSVKQVVPSRGHGCAWGFRDDAWCLRDVDWVVAGHKGGGVVAIWGMVRAEPDAAYPGEDDVPSTSILARSSLVSAAGAAKPLDHCGFDGWRQILGRWAGRATFMANETFR